MAALPFLAWPILGPLFSWAVTFVMTKYVYTPIHNTIMLIDTARTNFENQEEFDKSYLKMKLVDRADVPRETKRKALDEAHDNLVTLARYRVRVAA